MESEYVSSLYNIILNGEKPGAFQVYNSFTKARIEVSNDYYIDILSGKVPVDQERIPDFEFLKNNGFIVSASFDERLAVKYAFSKRYYGSGDLNLILMPTLACNFACPYCFENETRNKFIFNSNYFEAIKNHIIANKGKYYKLHIGLFGGEPLLMKDKLFSFINWVKNYSKENNITYDTSILTNGSLVDEDTILFLAGHKCQYFQITVDGSELQHDTSRCFSDGQPSFQLLMHNMQLCARLFDNATCKLVLRVNLNNNSLSDVKNTLEVIEPKYRNRIHVLLRAVFGTHEYTTHNQNTSNNLESYISLAASMGYKILKNENVFMSCEGCSDINVFHVLPDLSLWKCVIDLSYKDACIGKLRDDGKIEWNMSNMLSWYDCCDFTKEEQCVNCKYSPDCLGGCVKHKRQFGTRSCQSFDMRATPYKF